MPEVFLDSLQGVAGFERDAFEEVHTRGNAPTSVRINPAKFSQAILDLLPVQDRIPWSTDGYYLASRPSFTLDPFFHAGSYYVQEPSSMFLEQAIRQTLDVSKPLKVLDLCAAPGGKSTLIQSVVSKESLIISNEVIKQRAAVLEENCIKWGASNFIITNNDAKDFKDLEGFFDLIVIDAPCSGSGLFRKDPEAISEWSESNVALCAQRQQRILADVYPALKQNGILIYATCSYSRDEDENIADWLLGQFNMNTIQLQLQDTWKIIETQSQERNAYGYRFFPHLLNGEGFFLSCFKKNDGRENYPNRHSKKKIEKVNNVEQSMIIPFIEENEDVTFIKHAETILAVPHRSVELLATLQLFLYIKSAGVLVGRATHKELIPEHHLALSSLMRSGVVGISLKREQSLQYLRKLEVMIDTPRRGWLLAKYQDVNLGWIKHLGNRINNYYPKEWRILKSGN